jgi:hypothetical protein
MLPHAYELPAAILLVVGGALACFAGYRLFRIVLGIYGFFLGAMLASSIVGVTNTPGMVIAALLGGVAGAIVLVFAYFVGIAILGAGLGALLAHVVWQPLAAGDPHWAAVVVASIAGAIGAMLLQRYVIVVSTAFAGGWTMIVAGMSIAGEVAQRSAAKPAPASEVWILYPFSPAADQPWLLAVWVALGIAGVAVQLAVTGKKRRT